MPASLSTIAGKDGAGTTISGGVQALDLSGAGTGPWSFANILVDGASGSNRAAVKAASTAPAATDGALVVAMSPNAFDFGSGTSGTKTQRVIIDSSQIGGLQTADQTKSTGCALVMLPTDQSWTSLKQAYKDVMGGYQVVAASQTNAVLGSTGATGDYLADILVVPTTTSPGNVQLKDGSGTAFTVFAGGASSLSNLVPFPIYIGAKSTSGAWQVTTGAGLSVVANGAFT